MIKQWKNLQNNETMKEISKHIIIYKNTKNNNTNKINNVGKYKNKQQAINENT